VRLLVVVEIEALVICVFEYEVALDLADEVLRKIEDAGQNENRDLRIRDDVLHTVRHINGGFEPAARYEQQALFLVNIVCGE
jgi:hypothetical protein